MTSWWEGTRLVVGRELSEGARRKSYRITLAVLLVGGLAAAILPRVLSSDDRPSYELAVVGASPDGFRDALEAVADALEIDIGVEGAPSRRAAARAVGDGDVDAALVWSADASPPTLLQDDSASAGLLAAVSNAAVVSSTTERLEAAGVPAEEAGDVLAAPPVSELVDTPASTGAEGIGFAIVLVLYMALLFAGSNVASGVAVEKANRIAESLLSTVRASQLLAGKVIGIGILSFVSLLVVVVPVIVSFLVGGDLDVPDGAAGHLVAGLAWFVLGYALYAGAYAALGALVDRQEEAPGAAMPITTALIATYFVAMQAQGSPDSTLAVVTSLVPFTAPMVMPMRTSVGAASGVEVALSVLGVVLATALIFRYGSVVYRRAMVRTGRRLKLREVLRG